MLRRVGGYLLPREEPAPAASAQLERDGYALLRGVLSAAELQLVHSEIAGIYDSMPSDGRAGVHDDDRDVQQEPGRRRNWWRGARFST